MENRFWLLLKELDGTSYRTAASLGKALSLSEKTVRNLIKEINAVIGEHGAEIDSKQKYGYQLNVFDEEAWLDFLSRNRRQNAAVPGNADERAAYLLRYLLTHKDFVKLSELADQLYVSTQTLSAVIKRVETTLGYYHIQIQRKPYYGIRAEGSEFDMRCCLIRNFSSDSELFRRNFPVDDETLRQIFHTLMSTLPLYQIRLTEVSLQNLAIYIYLSILRMEQGFGIQEMPAEVAAMAAHKEYTAARAIFSILAADHGPSSPLQEPELCYAAVYIAGRRNIGAARGNFVISERTDTLVVEMLESIYSTFQIDLRDNLNLRMMLNQHLQPLDIRLRYGIPVENPILPDIKREYFFAYTMADQAAVSLREHYHCPIPEAEIGWLALIFEMAVESRHAEARLNILIVCASGSASSHLLLSRIKRAFSAYIADADVCTLFELEHRNLDGIDYIFTTVSIPFPVPVPILEIHDFLQHYEMQNIRKVLQRQHMQFLQEFYQERFFFTGLPGSTKEEVLRELCDRIRDRYPDLPDSFYDSVLKRENLGATDYGNLVAIPHPYEILTKDNVVAVAILDKPILWQTHQVQLLVMVALSSDENPHIASFYNVTSQFVMSETAVPALLVHPTYQELMDILCSIDPGQEN